MILALLIYEVGFHGGFFTIVYLPMMVSGLAIGYMATMLFAHSTGTVNLILGEWFGVKNRLTSRTRSGTAIILPVMIGWRYAGFNVAIFLAGLLAIPTRPSRRPLWTAPRTGSGFGGLLPADAALVHHRHHLLPDRFLRRLRRADPAGCASRNDEAKLLSVLFFSYAFTSKRLALGLTLTLQTFLAAGRPGVASPAAAAAPAVLGQELNLIDEPEAQLWRRVRQFPG